MPEKLSFEMLEVVYNVHLNTFVIEKNMLWTTACSKSNSRNIFGKIGVNINERDIQLCDRLTEKCRTIVKFVNGKNCMNILRVQKNLRHLDQPKLFFSEGKKVFANKSLCRYYRGILNKRYKLRVKTTTAPTI